MKSQELPPQMISFLSMYINLFSVKDRNKENIIKATEYIPLEKSSPIFHINKQYQTNVKLPQGAGVVAQ